MKPIKFVTRGKQSDFGMYFVCIGMVFYLSSSSRIIQKALGFPCPNCDYVAGRNGT